MTDEAKPDAQPEGDTQPAAQQSNDLKPQELPSLDWNTQEQRTSLNYLYAYAVGRGTDALNWYYSAKRWPRRFGRWLRGGAIALVAIAGIIPVLPLLGDSGTSKLIDPAWATVIAGVAALLISLDRFFGYTSAWIRYITAAQAIDREIEAFRTEWQARLAEVAGGDEIPLEQLQGMIYLCRDYLGRVQAIVEKETSKWVVEFRQVLQQLEKEVAESAERARRRGSIEVTFADDQAPDGPWRVSIDGGAARPYSAGSKHAAFTNLPAGQRLVRVKGTHGGKKFEFERVVTVTAGEVESVGVPLQ